MKIIPIASSSEGNCYVIESQGKQLIIDCGVPIKRIREKIGGFENVVGCLISHEHGDHAKYMGQLRTETAIPVYFQRESYYLPGLNLQFGAFKVYPIKLTHDVPCYGFLISTRSEKLFYATDTKTVNYTFPGLTHLMIEANYDYKLIAKSELNDLVIQRTIQNHLDIDSAMEFISRHQSLEQVWLLHLSDRHSNAKEFQSCVQNAFGIPTYIAPK